MPQPQDPAGPVAPGSAIPVIITALLALLPALALGCHRPLVIKRDDLLLHASPEPPPQPRVLRPTPAPAPPTALPYHPE
jgi:hypothetical protein